MQFALNGVTVSTLIRETYWRRALPATSHGKTFTNVESCVISSIENLKDRDSKAGAVQALSTRQL